MEGSPLRRRAQTGSPLSLASGGAPKQKLTVGKIAKHYVPRVLVQRAKDDLFMYPLGDT